MNINLDTGFIKSLKHGKLLYSLYDFSEKWYPVGALIQPVETDREELKRAKENIKENRRLDPIVMLDGYGVVSGFHILQAFKDLKYERIPVIFGKLK